MLSQDIKDGHVTSGDLKDGTVQSTDLSADVRAQLARAARTAPRATQGRKAPRVTPARLALPEGSW